MDELSNLFREEALESRRKRHLDASEPTPTFNVGQWIFVATLFMVALIVALGVMRVPGRQYWPADIENQDTDVLVHAKTLPVAISFALANVKPSCDLKLWLPSTGQGLTEVSTDDLRSLKIVQGAAHTKAFISIATKSQTLPEALGFRGGPPRAIPKLTDCVSIR